MIRLLSVTKTYQAADVETTALKRVSLELKLGEFVSVMGPSGCGKSTLLNIIGTLDTPSEGEYWFNDHNVAAYSEDQLTEVRKKSMGFIFQSFNLIDDLNVFENVELALRYRPEISANDRRERVNAVLERLRIFHRARHMPQQLSGGQQQRVAIARALVPGPKLILADEPTGNLDSVNGDEIMKILGTLNSEGTTVIMVTHSLSQAQRAPRIINMLDGAICSEPV